MVLSYEMFDSAPKFHHIRTGGGCNLNQSPERSAAATHIRKRLARFYDTVAPVYGFWSGFFESRAGARAYAAAHLSGNESVLEVAIGGGEFYSTLAKTLGLKRCVGVDLSAPMLRKACSLLAVSGIERRDLCRADALSLPFGRAVFDILFNLYMLDLLLEEDVPGVLQEFARVLRPGGRLIVVSMAEQAPVVNAIWMGLYRCSPVIVGGCRPLPVAEMLAAGGWKIDLRERISQSGFRSELVVAQFPAEGRR
jgi:ubiquinone/menaquinone biosynthesis C-methylase UbiE